MRHLFLLLVLTAPALALGDRLHHFEPEVIVGAPAVRMGLSLPDWTTVLLVLGLAVAPAFFTLGLHLGRSHRVRHVRLG